MEISKTNILICDGQEVKREREREREREKKWIKSFGV